MLHHYGKKISLVQIGNQSFQYLLNLNNYVSSYLIEILEDDGIEKVVFSGHQDIMMLKEQLSCSIKNIFDVAFAYSVLFPNFKQVGLQGVIKHYFGIEISKELQKTDWSKRPLTQDMKNYAASDVAYLIPIRDRMIIHLKYENLFSNTRRYFDSMELIKPLSSKVKNEIEFLDVFRGWKDNDPISSLALKRLFYYREEWAMENNRPRIFLFNNKELKVIATQLPKTINEFDNIGLKKYRSRFDIKQEIVDIINHVGDDLRNDPSLYDQEILSYLEITKKLGRENFELIRDDFSLDIEDSVEDFTLKRNALIKWRNQKTHGWGKPNEYFLSNLTIKKIATFNFKNRKEIPLVPGLSITFLDIYVYEMLNVLKTPNIFLNGISFKITQKKLKYSKLKKNIISFYKIKINKFLARKTTKGLIKTSSLKRKIIFYHL